ncbi:MAG: HAMP domain-containing sensor histidine kinase [Pseudomonadota bacterium]
MSALRQAQSGGKSIDAIADTATREMIQAIAGSQDKHNPTSRTAASYLRLIRQMLEAIRGGVSRNQFLSSLFSELAKDDASDRSVLVLEAYPEKSVRVRGLTAPYMVSKNPQRVENLRESLRGQEKSRFLIGLLVHRHSYDFELRSIVAGYGAIDDMRYTDEFDNLHGKGEFWLCSLPLPASESGEPERSLLALYPTGEGGKSFPLGAHQEWDIIQLVPDIFTLLQHRVRSLHDHVEEDQRKLLSGLAPSAITHELGTSLSLMESSLSRTTEILAELYTALAANDGELFHLAQELNFVRTRIDHAKRTTDAFTNYERRNPATKIDLLSLVREVETVLQHNLDRARSQFLIDIPDDLEVVSDARYIEHVVMNVVINALEAILPTLQQPDSNGVPDQTDPIEDPSLQAEKPLELEQGAAKEDIPDVNEHDSGPKHTIAIEAYSQDDKIYIIIANDGPDIPVKISSRIFEKGITSKPMGVGHGQGLYLCRQIAQHLGGSFGFAPESRLLSDATVKFRFTIPKFAKIEGDA